MDDMQGRDPRFAQIDRLSESLRKMLASGHIDLRAASSLAWLTPHQQDLVAEWVTAVPRRHVGATKARRLLRARQEGKPLNANSIATILDTQKGTRPVIRVPLSKLPKGLSREDAEQWLDEAIEAYKHQ